jgi:hypothetical protein
MAKDRFGAVLAVGVGSIVFWHAVFNLGMVTGLLPGRRRDAAALLVRRSSVMTILIGVGLVMNVSMRRFYASPTNLAATPAASAIPAFEQVLGPSRGSASGTLADNTASHAPITFRRETEAIPTAPDDAPVGRVPGAMLGNDPDAGGRDERAKEMGGGCHRSRCH